MTDHKCAGFVIHFGSKAQITIVRLAYRAVIAVQCTRDPAGICFGLEVKGQDLIVRLVILRYYTRGSTVAKMHAPGFGKVGTESVLSAYKGRGSDNKDLLAQAALYILSCKVDSA